MMLYFAYGSNINPERMRDRKVNFSSRIFARLDGYRLVFNKKAHAGNFGYANIIAEKGSVVEGVIYEFPDEEISLLDKHEGYPKHYDKILLEVTDGSGIAKNAVVYVAQFEKIIDGLSPTKEYLQHILKGKDVFSDSYFNTLENTQTVD